jgi:hypothetical protein
MPAPATNSHFTSRIHQATGMISVQAHCDLSEAFATAPTAGGWVGRKS